MGASVLGTSHGSSSPPQGLTSAAHPAAAADPRPQLLFVDDEASMLAGLRRLLWRHRDDWGLHWATSGPAALELLDSRPVDIVVTDMRMPGADGVALLDQLRCRHPSVARIVLSGHADHERIIAAAGPTQQFLAKPCDSALLTATLERAVDTLGLMADPGLRATFGSLQTLPKPPDVYAALTALIAQPDTSLADVARLVETDVATTTEVLKLINSSFFGLAREVRSVERAVGLLGTGVLKALVLAGSVFTATAGLPAGLDARALAADGLRACLALDRIGRLEGWGAAQVAGLGLAGQLHDVGLLVLAAADPAGWAALQQADPATPRRTAELAAFGCPVGRATAYLLGLWGFSSDVVSLLAAQPVDLADAADRGGASPAALALAFAHDPGVLVESALEDCSAASARDYLTARRLAAWRAVL